MRTTRNTLNASTAAAPSLDTENEACRPKPNLADLPVRVPRETGAELVSKYFFEISPRTLERWPLTWQRLNGRAHCETAELLAVAASMLAASPLIKGGRRAAAPRCDFPRQRLNTAAATTMK